MESGELGDLKVAIGGLGGSGTRIVAQILKELGFYLGPALNRALDNLLFTLLFNRPAWFDKFPQDTDIQNAAELYLEIMQNGLPHDASHAGKAELERLHEDLKNFPRNLGITSAKFEQIMAARPPHQGSVNGLAWKEPNTHVFIGHLARQFPKLKYVHVIRNGLDMAVSKNRNQQRNWGEHFGIGLQDTKNIERTSLAYWVAANRRAVKVGQTQMRKRFYLLNYDNFCRDPASEIPQLLAFLDCEMKQAQKTKFVQTIDPTSIGRYRQAPKGLFRDEDFEAVQEFGFSAG